ncbi:hypothetical protein SAMN06297358_1148 [Pedobacter xixiisoli]|uniref:Uncharacterized protein n=1 Tax=Pedobacter xixiisoli TaxID=1476464 RepID=A0A285ZUI8_9SPHI|nr:hypothetical protein SAMN06297358_1148 [Pedobacter xixiisoli]
MAFADEHSNFISQIMDYKPWLFKLKLQIPTSNIPSESFTIPV